MSRCLPLHAVLHRSDLLVYMQTPPVVTNACNVPSSSLASGAPHVRFACLHANPACGNLVRAMSRPFPLRAVLHRSDSYVYIRTQPVVTYVSNSPSSPFASGAPQVGLACLHANPACGNQSALCLVLFLCVRCSTGRIRMFTYEPRLW